MSLIEDIAAGIDIFNFFRKLKNVKMNRRFKDCDYYFNNFNKKTYIDSNGNGVVIVSYELIVLNVSKTKAVYIDMNISDAQDICEFPKFNKMRNPKAKAFQDFKFMINSKEDIVNSVKEYYDNLTPAERNLRKQSKKHIGLKVELNQNKLQKNGVYHIMYMFSIPKMFTIVNGRFGGTAVQNELSTVSTFDSKYNKLKCSLYLSSLIKVNGNVKPELISAKNNRPVDIVTNFEQNMLYNKYVVETDKLYNYSSFGFYWNVSK